MEIKIDPWLFYEDQRREVHIVLGFSLFYLLILFFAGFTEVIIFGIMLMLWVVYVWLRFQDKVKRVKNGDSQLGLPFYVVSSDGRKSRNFLPGIFEWMRIVEVFEKFNPNCEEDVALMRDRYGEKFAEMFEGFLEKADPQTLKIYGTYIDQI